MDSLQTKNTQHALDAERRHAARVAEGRRLLAQDDTLQVEISRNKRTKRTSLWRWILRCVFIGISSCVIAGVVICGIALWHAHKTVARIALPENQVMTRSFAKDATHAAQTVFGATQRQSLRGEDAPDHTINVLLLGKGTPDHPGRDLTDTLMIMRINTKENRVALLSLPRDLSVRIPGSPETLARINSLYGYGVSQGVGTRIIRDAITDVTGLNIHYILIVDFNAFITVVDALGGINVTVERAINDSRYPGPGFSYETFHIDKGLQYLDGVTALKYVRSRHGDPEGDFGRAKRQQQVLQAMKDKAFSLGTIANPHTMTALIDAVADHVVTDISLSDAASFLALAKEVDTHNITTTVIDAWKPQSLLRATHHGAAFVLVPRAGITAYDEIRSVAATIFDTTAQQREQDAIAKESPQIIVVRAGAQIATAVEACAVIRNRLSLAYHACTIRHDTTGAVPTHAITISDASQRTHLFTTNRLHLFFDAPVVAVPYADPDAITVTVGPAADNASFMQPSVSQDDFISAQGDDDPVHGMIKL